AQGGPCNPNDDCDECSPTIQSVGWPCDGCSVPTGGWPLVSTLFYPHKGSSVTVDFIDLHCWICPAACSKKATSAWCRTTQSRCGRLPGWDAFARFRWSAPRTASRWTPPPGTRSSWVDSAQAHRATVHCSS